MLALQLQQIPPLSRPPGPDYSYVIMQAPLQLSTGFAEKLQPLQAGNNFACYLPQKVAQVFDYIFHIKNECTKSQTMLKVAKITTPQKQYAVSYISTLFMQKDDRIKALVQLALELINSDDCEEAVLIADDLKKLGANESALQLLITALCDKMKFKEAQQVAKKVDNSRDPWNFILDRLAKAGLVEELYDLQSKDPELQNNDSFLRQICIRIWGKFIVDALVNKGDLEGARKKIDEYQLGPDDKYKAVVLMAQKLTEQNREADAITLVRNKITEGDISRNKCLALAAIATTHIRLGARQKALTIVNSIIAEPGVSASLKADALYRISSAFAHAHLPDLAMQVADKIPPDDDNFCSAYSIIAYEMIEQRRYQEVCDIAINKILPNAYNARYEVALFAKKLYLAKEVDFAQQIIKRAGHPLMSQLNVTDHCEIIENFANMGLFTEAVQYAFCYIKDPVMLNHELVRIIQQMVEHDELQEAIKIVPKIHRRMGCRGEACLAIIKKLVQRNLGEALVFAKNMQTQYALSTKEVCEAFSLIAREHGKKIPLAEVFLGLRTIITQTFGQEHVDPKNPDANLPPSPLVDELVGETQVDQLVAETMLLTSKGIAEDLIQRGDIETATFVLATYLANYPIEPDKRDQLFAQMAEVSLKQV